MTTPVQERLEANIGGQAQKRGLIPRTPAGDRVLADAAVWLTGEYPDAVRWTRQRTLDSGAHELAVDLHPAVAPLIITADDDGRIAVHADTAVAGPGYHRFVGRVLERLGLELSIGWSRDDPLDITFGERPIVEQSDLTWLGPRLVRAQKAAAAGRPAPQLGLPNGTRYTFEGAIATALGPRDAEWLEKAIADPRVAVDITPWWADATDARFLLNRALCLMWLQVRWRTPAVEGEADLLDEVHRLLSRAFPMDPSLTFPWHAWAELCAYRGINDQMAKQAASRALRPHRLAV